jgi:hypothetical protein
MLAAGRNFLPFFACSAGDLSNLSGAAELALYDEK